jgi:hypothetical protein
MWLENNKGELEGVFDGEYGDDLGFSDHTDFENRAYKYKI